MTSIHMGIMSKQHLNPVTEHGAGTGSKNRTYCIFKQERMGIGSIHGEFSISSSRFAYLASDIELMSFIISKYGSNMSSCRNKEEFFSRPSLSTELRIGAACLEPNGTKRVIDLTDLFRTFTTSKKPPC